MQFIVTFDWNGDKVRLAKPPQGNVVTVGALREAAAVLLEWIEGMPVQLVPIDQKEGECSCQPTAEA